MKNNLGKICFIMLFILFACTLRSSFAYMNFDTKKVTTGNSGVSVSASDGNKLEIFKDTTSLEKVSGTYYSKIEMRTRAVITATSSHTDTYSLYYQINENGFKDSVNGNKVIIKIFKPDGTELTSLNGLTRTSVGNISGFEVTNKEGIITIFEDREITTTNKKTEEWKVIVYIEDSGNIEYSSKLTEVGDVGVLKGEVVDTRIVGNGNQSVTFAADHKQCFVIITPGGAENTAGGVSSVSNPALNIGTFESIYYNTWASGNVPSGSLANAVYKLSDVTSASTFTFRTYTRDTGTAAITVIC